MEIRRVPPEEGAIRRVVEELWIQYSRDLAVAVAAHDLADDVDLVAEQTEFWLEQFTDSSREIWVAVDHGTEGTDDRSADDQTATPFAETDGDPVGFVTTERDESPAVFDGPDRLVVGDFYVAEPYRGTGLARDLFDRAVEQAREADCQELALDVDVDNERALAFYEKVGFEPARHRMRAPVADL